jgi:hypothetical protein
MTNEGILYQAQSAVAAERSREALEGMHASHCCWMHGCKYGGDDCPVVAGIAQRTACEVCDEEISVWWPLIKAANAAYDAGRRAGQREGADHGFAEGSYRGFRQGRIYAETGRLEPIGPLPAFLAVEVSQEMVDAFGEGWEQADGSARYLDPDSVVPGTRRRAGLSAVLAIVRRDVAASMGERE